MYKLEVLKDVNGKPYIGIDVTNDVQTKMCWNILNLYLTENDWSIINNQLLIRNGNKYHLTVFNVAECNKNKSLLSLAGYDVQSLLYKGIGYLEYNDMFTYFVCIDSSALNALRYAYDLSEKDFHITMGFTDKDLFNGRKNDPNLFTFV